MNFAPLMLPKDKANHALYGYVAFILGAILARYSGLPQQIGGWGLVAFISIGKERYDRLSGTGVPDSKDILAALLGAVPAAAHLWLVAPD